MSTVKVVSLTRQGNRLPTIRRSSNHYTNVLFYADLLEESF